MAVPFEASLISLLYSCSLVERQSLRELLIRYSTIHVLLIPYLRKQDLVRVGLRSRGDSIACTPKDYSPLQGQLFRNGWNWERGALRLP